MIYVKKFLFLLLVFLAFSYSLSAAPAHYSPEDFWKLTSQKNTKKSKEKKTQEKKSSKKQKNAAKDAGEETSKDIDVLLIDEENINESQTGVVPENLSDNPDGINSEASTEVSADELTLSDQEVTAKENEAAEALERQALEAEAEVQRQELLLIEQKLENERLERAEALQKTLEEARNRDIQRYQKEFLQDYVVPDTPDAPEDEEIVFEKITDPNLADSEGRTLLMKAAKAGNDWQIAHLLSTGAKINQKDKDGWTALMYAVRYQENLSTVNLLLDSGANVKLKNNFNSSALSIASVYNNNPEILNRLLGFYTVSEKEVLKAFTLLLSSNQKSEYLQNAKVNVFIQKSIPLNTYYEGKTPLMYAAQFGFSTKIIKLLIDNNAVISIRSSEGKSAFDYAKDNKNLKHDEIYWSLNRNN